MIKPSMIIGGLILAILILIFNILKLPFGSFQISFLDIGQGDSIYIRTPDDYHILIDGGPSSIVIEELSDVIPVYNRTIDILILTHPHADHVNGFVETVKRYEVKKVLIVGTPSNNPYYVKFLELIDAYDIPLYFAQSDKDIKVGEYIYLDIVWPIKSMAGVEFENLNKASLSVRVILRDLKILLTGDAEIEEEEEMIESGFDLDADILKAGHHGSRTASSDNFLDIVDPETVVIQCGKGNNFGHPHKETLRKLYERDIDIKRNDIDGRVDLFFSFF